MLMLATVISMHDIYEISFSCMMNKNGNILLAVGRAIFSPETRLDVEI